MSVTILVVEDDPQQRHLMRALLELDGYSILEAANGRDALGVVAAAGDRPPALVITDNFMPEMDGLALVRALRASDGAGICGVPVILVSAADEDRAVLAALRGGRNYFVQKPFTAEALLAAVRDGVSGVPPA
jgi:CheY-like chemotaxis protein